MANPNAGRIIWHELKTSDPVAAAHFYGQLFGWSVREVELGRAGTYRIFQLGGQDVAACMPDHGMPTAWIPFVGSEDVERAVKTLVEHHGKVILPAREVPDAVRFAIAADAQGATFGILGGLGRKVNEPLPEGPPAPGTFCWDELHTGDKAAAGRFYGALFGWTGKEGDGDPMQYWHWVNDGKDIGGMMSLEAPGVSPHWLGYVAVAEVEAAAKKAQDLGAKILMPAMDVPKVGSMAVLRDPTGALFALFRSARS
jgi:uncharacterized protein